MSHFMKWYRQHLAACEPRSLAMLLSAGQLNSMQGLLKHWLEQRTFRGLLMCSPHFDMMLIFMKWHCQHMAACKPSSSAMLLSAGHFTSMQGLLKHWLEQRSFHGLLMQPCRFRHNVEDCEMVLPAFSSLRAHNIGNAAFCRSDQQYARPSEALARAENFPWPAHVFTPL